VNTVLIAEDEPEVRNYLALALSCHGYNVEFAQDGEEAVACLERDADRIAVLLLDLIMPRKDGFETLKEVRRTWPRLPVITLSGCCTPAHVASVMKNGAIDFLSKPIGHDDLLRAIESALASSYLDRRAEVKERDARALATYLAPKGTWPERVEALLSRMGPSDVPVLLRGETGVGKEVFARKLHARSKRADRPFLKLNCAALPSELVESELFGYERGAFTGAYRTTPGKFEMADKGTILLDEIGDMDFKLQAKLLQVLQDHEFLRLGAKTSSRVDVRIMAATHCDLEKAIQDGRFREDLYYRLNIVEVHVPPLRERKDEIDGLAEYFLDKYAPVDGPELPSGLRQVLIEHDWPGNIRELENVIRRFLIFRNVDVIAAELKRKSSALASTVSQDSAALPAAKSRVQAEHKHEPVSETSKPAEVNGHSDAASRSSPTLAQVEEAGRKAEIETILAVLNASLWNRKQAAKLLKIDYKALLYKMGKLGIGERSTENSTAGNDIEE
jgi:two-component system response regulator AtoC